ncbi:MAG: hypothetical protein KIT84_11040 [Labilithrix sp.]|nr:hypothetical protein [Labilithrix sp.]MCW5811543.1 hypothetical protein [Labilithrix sp.]
MFTPPKLSPHEIRKVAADAVCDERTVRAYLRSPDSVRSTSAERISSAIARLHAVASKDDGRT